MNSIPKFRAWHKADKLMQVVKSLDWNDNDDNLRAVYAYRENGNFIEQHDPEEIELMQWTGLKDRNYKDIYEGDLLEHANDMFVVPSLFPLGRENEVELVKSWSANTRNLREHDTTDWISWSRDDWEVIGNIYENEDLLNVSQR
jgi:uncharacterized phage protein (TIGR01671 family)